MVHTTLRHPDLRLRDIKHIVALKRFDISWERGTVPESEWVYASLEDAVHRERLLEWLRSKNISESADAFVLGGGYNDWTSITWGEILARPEKFFDRQPEDYQQGLGLAFGSQTGLRCSIWSVGLRRTI